MSTKKMFAKGNKHIQSYNYFIRNTNKEKTYTITGANEQPEKPPPLSGVKNYRGPAL